MLGIVQNSVVFPCRMVTSLPDEGSSSSSRHQQLEDGGLITTKNTEWYNALLGSDCKSLMKQLQKNGSLVVQTGHNGCTVLLAAARRGCTPLVNQVMNLFKDFTGQFITGKDHAKILLSPLHDLFQAEDFRTKLRAVEIMEHFMGSDVIQRHMNHFYGDKFSASFRRTMGVLVGLDVTRSTATHEGNEDSKYSSTSHRWQSTSTYRARDPPSNQMNPLEGGGQNESGIRNCCFKAHGEAHNDFTSIPVRKIPFVSLTHTSGNDESIDEDVLAIIRHTADTVLKDKRFKELRKGYFKHKDYNFDETRREFIFHYACQSMSRRSIEPGTGPNNLKYQIVKGSAYDFLWSFIQKVLQGSNEDKILPSLYGIKNWQGKTPCHAALSGSAFGFEILSNVLRVTNDATIELFLNARDARGWTPLHKAVAMVSEHDCWRHRIFINLLLQNEEVNVNEKLPESEATPLHLAILHNLPQVVGSLIQRSKNIEGVINASLKRNIRFSSTTQSSRRSSKRWSPLQLATIMGHPSVVETLVTKVCMVNLLCLLLLTQSMRS